MKHQHLTSRLAAPGAALLSLTLMSSASLAAASSDLKVSAVNKHYLMSNSDGRPVFVVADTAWRIVNLDRMTVTSHLDARKSQGFNTIILEAGGSGPGARVPNAYGDYAFERHPPQGKYDNLADFTRPIVTSGNDPRNAASYDYWDHLEYILQEIANREMYAVVAPTAGFSVTGKGLIPDRVTIKTDAIAYGYGNFLGKKFSGFRNIVWAMGFDANPQYPEVKNVALRDTRSRFRALAEGIADGVNGITKQDGSANYSTTLMTYHPNWRLTAAQSEADPTGRSSSTWFQNDAWLDFNSLQSFPPHQVSLIDGDYKKTLVKPTWLMEPARYEGSLDGKFTPWVARWQMYQAVFGGAMGIGYGRRYTSEPDLNVDWQKYVRSEGTEDIRHLVALINALSDDTYLKHMPDQGLIYGSLGKMQGGTQDPLFSDHIQAMRDTSGTFAYLYSANGRNITVNLNRLAGPSVNAHWFNPKTGLWRVGSKEVATKTPFLTGVVSGLNAPRKTFDPPGSPGANNDWVLVLNLK